MGVDAYNALINNTIFKNQQDIRRVDLGTINRNQQSVTGGTLHGEIDCGPYTVRLWSSSGTYVRRSGSSDVRSNYIDKNKYALIADDAEFLTRFCQVPALPEDAPQTSDYVIDEYTDNRNKTREIHVKAAVLPIPATIDRMFTRQVLA